MIFITSANKIKIRAVAIIVVSSWLLSAVVFSITFSSSFDVA